MQRRVTLLDQFEEQLVEAEGGWLCHYCRRAVKRSASPRIWQATVDHMIPLSKGGRTTIDNLVLACVDCNSKKGSRDYLPFWKSKQQERLHAAVKQRKQRG